MRKETPGGNIPSREYKAFSFKLDDADEDSGEFSGYAAVFGNRDSGDDIIEKGAFARTIVENIDRIKILSQHDDGDLPIGKPLELREDDRGLFIRGKISDTQKGRDVRTLLRDGVLSEMSIGYEAVDFEYDGETGVRHLKEVRLWEISIVTWAMNEQAKIEGFKALASDLKSEIKAGGRISRTKLAALRPFMKVVRELIEILDPLLDEPEDTDDSPQENSLAPVVPNTVNTRTKKSNVTIELIRK